MFEHQVTPPLKVRKRVAPDYWLAGYKAGYTGANAQPPRGKHAAEHYWRGYGEGVQAKQRSAAALQR